MKGLWIALAVLVLLSPLGLLASGTAWGEWGVEELKEMGLGFVPRGMERLAAIWPAPMPDYKLLGLDERLGYIASAAIGIGLVVLVTWALSRGLPKEKSQ